MMIVALTAGALRADSLEQQFIELPMAARRNTGPLFWLHGDESPEQLDAMLNKVTESGNGSFTAESRPHLDWLGEGWYRDLGICLDAARRHDLQMWIFDEDWWPSQTVAGRVPEQYAAKRLVGKAVTIEPGGAYAGTPGATANFIALAAGRLDAEGAVEAESLRDLTSLVGQGKVQWSPPADGRAWQVMEFAWECAPKLKQGGRLAVDGMSRDCVEWFIQCVYAPHYARFGKDFGKTIPGYFYDEPETPGDWGTELDAMFKERGVDRIPAYVAWKFKLAGEAQAAARYQYAETRAETWGRVMYGGLTAWCRKHGVLSIGHFMEHGLLYLNNEYCAGDMMRLQKYSDMGGIDLVCRQMYPGQRPHDIYQTPKLGSSISHVYGKQDDRAMCEIYGGYNQELTYPEMKWLCDQHQVRGINFMIPHSFNPRAPYDRDYPPYFANGGFEPRYPLYRVWADYSSRLSLMLTGGHHVCPVAVLFSGNARQVGAYTTPEDLTSVLQDALYDCDWLPFERFEDRVTQISGGQLQLHGERYRILIVPPSEVMPYATLEKVKEFFDKGGIVAGYNFLPSRSATMGKTSADIAALRTAIWGEAPLPGETLCQRSAAGGRSYFLPAAPTVAQIQQVFTADAGVRPALEVIEGETGGWLHVLHRVKENRDLFFVCNQNHTGDARKFTLRITAAGEPECWDAMRNEITALPFKRITADQVEVDLTLEPSESVLLLFQKERRTLPMRLERSPGVAGRIFSVVRGITPPELVIASAPPADTPAVAEDRHGLAECAWIWGAEGDAAKAAPPGPHYFRTACTVPAGRRIKSALFIGTCDNRFTLFVNGQEAGRSSAASEGWREPTRIDMTAQLVQGENRIAVAALNLTEQPSPAGLIGRLEILFEEGEPQVLRTDAAWKTSGTAAARWNQSDFDDSAWTAAKKIGQYGCAPWGDFAAQGTRNRALTLTPVKSDPFAGSCDLPSDLNLAQSRVYIEMDEIVPEEAARVTVNGEYAGGFIGRPFRLDVTRHLKAGANTIVVEPFAPKEVWLRVR